MLPLPHVPRRHHEGSRFASENAGSFAEMWLAGQGLRGDYQPYLGWQIQLRQVSFMSARICAPSSIPDPIIRRRVRCTQPTNHHLKPIDLSFSFEKTCLNFVRGQWFCLVLRAINFTVWSLVLLYFIIIILVYILNETHALSHCRNTGPWVNHLSSFVSTCLTAPTVWGKTVFVAEVYLSIFICLVSTP